MWSLFAGNMWAQDWGNIYDILAPYPNVSQTNLTRAMLAQVITHVFTNHTLGFYRKRV